ncbi:hypothetical protein EDC56_0273 [Sinobacterium caligoides]|uniref:Uncharacterized protein n=1 Tax=Sinobacterium caligoides TaxID=933926 RepID=A0A3N2DY15_9GAMM|nr:hypothetical protein [Sinobacterium caligoides]ROS04760.1 hypothetical protein EDC56_0273 [Sinobacterium caligoides]
MRMKILYGLLLLLGGCESIGGGAFDVRLQDQLAEKHFQQAIHTVEREQARNPELNLAPVLDEVRGKAEQYRNSVVAQGKSLVNKAHWLEAVELLEQGVKNYPSAEMLAYRQILLRAREDHLRWRWRELNYQRADGLPEAIAAVNSILAVNPEDARAQALYKQYHNESKLLLPYVLSTAAIHEQQQRLSVALKDYRLAKQLAQDDSVDADIKRLSRELSEAAKSRSHKKNKRLVDARKQSCADFEVMLAEGELLMAADQLVKMQDLGVAKNEMKGYRETLQLLLDRAVTGYVMEGNTAYTLGDIEVAIESWQRALELQPGNAVIVEKLSRARAFKSYYESLRP